MAVAAASLTAQAVLLAVCVSAVLAGEIVAPLGQVEEIDLPSVSFRDLQRTSGFGRTAARHALTSLGALEVSDVPGYAAARRAALAGLTRCLRSGADVGLQRVLADGTVRRSIAAQTSASGTFSELDVDGRAATTAECAGTWRADADHLRLLVRAAALQAAGLLRDGSPPMDAALATAEALEHFHMYQPRAEATSRHPDAADSRSAGAGPHDSIPLHVDAGFLIAATAGLQTGADGELLPASSGPMGGLVPGPLILQLDTGELARPRLREDSVLLLVGQGLAAAASHDGSSVRAMPHALRLEGASTRAWYGAMLLAPDLVQDKISAAQGLACWTGASASGSEVFAHPTDLSTTCSEGKVWCWMNCMPVPDDCKDSSELQCVDAKTKLPWLGGHEMCPSCILDCPEREAIIAKMSERPFCAGMSGVGIDMYMNGFQWSGDPDNACLVYLFPGLVLDTKVKFWAAVAFTFLIALLGPETLRIMHEQSVARGQQVKKRSGAPLAAHYLHSKGVSILCVMHAYMVMLLSMTFSLEIFIAIVLGLAFGRPMGKSTEHFSTSTLCCQVNQALSDKSSTPGTRTKGKSADSTGSTPRPISFSDQPPKRFEGSTRAELAISGMTCASCTGAVERCLRAQPGVVDVTVVLLQERATVYFDPSQVTASQLCAEVEDIGFDAVLVQEFAAASQADNATLAEIPAGRGRAAATRHVGLGEPLLGGAAEP